MQNDKIRFKMTEEESLLLERYNYVWKSHQAYVSTLAGELARCENPEAKAMLEEEKDLCKRAYLDLLTAQTEVLRNHCPEGVQEGVHFFFDFRTQDVSEL